MVPVNHAAAPALERGVLNRLKRLDPSLRVTWSPYALNPETGRPIEMSGRVDPESGEQLLGAVRDPAFYLWKKDPGSSHHFFVGVSPRFGHLEVLRLETDFARFYRPEDILRVVKTAADRRRALDRAAMEQLQRDKIRANRKRIHDLVFEGKRGLRSTKVVSYGGMTRRSSSAERALIEKEAREDGWELPSH
jgi:hypothetical protein